MSRGISSNQRNILLYLRDHSLASVEAISAAVKVPVPSVLRALESLAKRGFAAKAAETVVADGRVTAAGNVGERSQVLGFLRPRD